MCQEKYIITFIDTENVLASYFTELTELVEYKYGEYKNAGYYCFGIDDGKSTKSLGWKELTDNLKGLTWISVKGVREKNLVDKSIIKNIKKMIDDPEYSHIDIWVIATSDGDFEPVINKIRDKGHKVVIASDNLISDKLMKSGCEIKRL